jgi:Kef-type K+ transport system membrane component KefB
MINRHKLLALVAAVLIIGIGGAHAVITGTSSTNQQQQFRVGQLQVGAGTVTAVSNAATLAFGSGIITTESLTTAAGATQAITLTNSRIAAGDMVFSSIDPGSSTGTPTIANIAVSANTAVFLIRNAHASVALNAPVKISFMINKAGNNN